MSNPLIQRNGNAPVQGKADPRQALAQLKSDPVGMLKQAGYNVPDETAGNPMAMIQHLITSGQIPKSRLEAFIKK